MQQNQQFIKILIGNHIITIPTKYLHQKYYIKVIIKKSATKNCNNIH